MCKACITLWAPRSKNCHQPHTCLQAYEDVANRKKQRPCSMVGRSPHDLYFYRKGEYNGKLMMRLVHSSATRCNIVLCDPY
jgi:hypothetical protein